MHLIGSSRRKSLNLALASLNACCFELVNVRYAVASYVQGGVLDFGIIGRPHLGRRITFGPGKCFSDGNIFMRLIPETSCT